MNIDVSLPSSWQELSEKQLLYVYFLIAEGYTPMAVRVFCLIKWSGMKVLKKGDDGRWLVEYNNQKVAFSIDQLAAAAETLAFLDEPSAIPTRPESVDGRQALPADFMGVPFEKFLCVDNFYQGWLHTQDNAMIRQMGDILYQAENIQLSKAEEIAVCYWVIALKAMFARRFRNFFRSSTNSDGNLLESSPSSPERLQESVDIQIRALTKGDVTKEAEVLQLDTWRVLTELDAQAKEYEELRKVYKA